MQVALDRANDYRADRLGAGLGQQRAQNIHARLHRLRSH